MRPHFVSYGSPVPDFDFTSEISALSIAPSTLRSSRKLDGPTALPDCDLVWLISAESTAGSALVSPTSRPMVTEALLPPFTPVRLMVVYWALGTPVKFTVHWFWFGPPTNVPVLATPHVVTGLAKVKINL